MVEMKDHWKKGDECIGMEVESHNQGDAESVCDAAQQVVMMLQNGRS